MKLTTSWRFETGKITKELGIVVGNSTKTRNVIRDWTAGIRNFLGHEVVEYKELLNKSRKTCINRMIEEASKLGANGIINIRFETSEIGHGIAELITYGTAVVVKWE